MARTIWKYPLDPDADVLVHGENPIVVHIGLDPADEDPDSLHALTPTAWVELDPTAEGWLNLRFTGTGEEHPGVGWNPVGSAVCGPNVWHVYAKATL